MNRARNLGMIVAPLVGLVTPQFAGAQADDIAELRAELEAMRAELAAMQAQTNATWMDEARESEMRALIADVLADADSRSGIGGDGVSAGYNGKEFFLEGEDFRLNINGQFQFRYVNNYSDDRASEDEDLQGFEIRRAKLGFSGYIADPKIGYTLVLANDRVVGNTFLEDATISYTFDNDWKLRAGKMKVPFLFEELLSSKRQLAVDRGLSTEFFTLNYAEMVQLEIPIEDVVKVYLAYSDGANTESSTATSQTVDYAFTGRAQTKLAGEWNQMKDLVAYDDEFAAFVGGAVHFQKFDGALSGTMFAWTIDGVIKTGNLVVMGAVMGATSETDDRDQIGLLAQAGYNLTKRLQPFLRWDYIDDGSVDPLNAFTGGFNYYLKQQSAKFTTDIVWVISPNDPTAVPGLNGGEFSSGLGLSSAGLNDDEDQIAFRAQFQLLF